MNSAGSVRVTAIVCAAGKGERAGFSENKLLRKIGGKTVLERTLSAFDVPAVKEILVTASEEDFAKIAALCARFPRARAVSGGVARFDSVYNALREAKSEVVLVHDGARPFVALKDILGCIASVLEYGSGVCAVPCVDTVALADETERIVEVPPPRARLLRTDPAGLLYERPALRL